MDETRGVAIKSGKRPLVSSDRSDFSAGTAKVKDITFETVRNLRFSDAFAANGKGLQPRNARAGREMDQGLRRAGVP